MRRRALASAAGLMRARTLTFAAAGVAFAVLIAGCSVEAEPEAESAETSEIEPGVPVRGTPRPATDVEVLNGIDVLAREHFAALRQRRVGLITNQTGIDSGGVSTIDRLARAADVELVALFSPEHGIRGTGEPGEAMSDTVDATTGLPVYSLYGATREPAPAALEGLDILVFDIQGVGARYYTYQWTMTLAMRAAAKADIEFMVLDRPNPIGGLQVQGNVLDPAFASFVGLYPVAMRHGLTVGELALLVNDRFAVGARLTVIAMRGWARAMSFAQTGLDWIAPSPNMPTPATALHYPGLCLFEGTNLSVGRGTEHPFEQIGAPWLDGDALARWLSSQELPGVTFAAVSFTPEAPGDGKFAGQTVSGVRFAATEVEDYDPSRTAVAALVGVRRLHPERFAWLEEHFDRLAGTDRLRTEVEGGRGWTEIVAAWDDQEARFRAMRRPYLLYE